MKRYYRIRRPLYRRRARDSEKYNYSVTALADPNTYAEREEDDYKKNPDDFVGTDIENYEEGSDEYWDYFYDLGNMDFDDDLNYLYTSISDDPAKIAGTLGRWDGNHQIYPEYHQTMKEALDRIIYSNYDKRFKLMATPDFKHFLYTESNHDSSGTVFYIDEVSDEEYEENR